MAEVTLLADVLPAEPAAGDAARIELSRRQAEKTNAGAPAGDISYAIKDHRYMDRLKRLRDLQDFLLAETVKIRDEDARLPGDLNLFVYQLDGRMPLRQDWTDLESCTQTLFSYLNGDLRKKFLLGQAPPLIAWIPVVFLALALASLLGALYLRWPPFICYLAWMISLGAIGAVAFISVNTLSIQTTATFDINNRRLILVRVVLGALFAVVLSIAFGYQSYILFLTQVGPAAAAGTAPTVNGSELIQHSLLLLLPFLLGFSTTLVIAVLNRLVESVGIFFGGPTPVANTGAAAGSGGTPTMPVREPERTIRGAGG